MGGLPANSKRRGPRRPTNVTLQANLLAEAKQLGINISEACEAGLQSVWLRFGGNAGWRRTAKRSMTTMPVSNEMG